MDPVLQASQKIRRDIESWRNRQIEGEFPYLFLDGVALKRSCAGEVRSLPVLIAVGVGADGYREILGVVEGDKETLDAWRGFLRHLNIRGLRGVQLVIGNTCSAWVEAADEIFPAAQWQRCVLHFYHDVCRHVPKDNIADIARMLKAIHCQEDRRSAQHKVDEVIRKLRAARLAKAAEVVEAEAPDTLTYLAFSSNHWTQIKSNNALERIIRYIRRRTKVVDASPDGRCALMLFTGRLRQLASTRWGNRRYLDMAGDARDPTLSQQSRIHKAPRLDVP